MNNPLATPPDPVRVAYFCSGPANLVAAHHSWRSGKHEPTEVSITFSGQIQEACQRAGSPTLMISTHPEPQHLEDRLFKIEHRPRVAASGIRFHLAEVAYFWKLFKSARTFKVDLVLVDSGMTNLYLFGLFRLTRIKVAVVLHNTLWPTGFFPTRAAQRAILALDKALFWKGPPLAVLSDSPECERQVRRLVGEPNFRTYQVRAQFNPDYFRAIKPAVYPAPGETFNVLFIGRIERLKGVFDILKMAALAERRMPGRIKWRICGRGADFDELAAVHRDMGLEGIVELVGWVSLDKLQALYNDTQACIVPTRSVFTEALAMTAAESVLAGRPFVSNPVVPATEIMASACLVGKTDDVESHCEQVLRLATDQALWESLRNACSTAALEFLDRSRSLTGPVGELIEWVRQRKAS